MNAARIVYQLSVLSAMVSITQVPYDASIISHEKMGVFAYMSILDVTLKLLICYLLYITPFDRLVTYGALVLIVSIVLQMVYRYYCVRHFEECHFQAIADMSILKPMLSFSGWDLFGNFSVMARSQGVNIILNMFFGPAINAACGFSNSVANAVYGFANNFMTAVRPPIVKSYSINDISKMEELMINVSKYSFCLMLLLSTPFFFESQFVLNVWLKTPPKYTNIFCALELGVNLVSVIFLPLMFAIHASGRIKFMSIVNGTIWFMTIPITYILLKLGFSPVVPFATKVILMFFVAVSNIYSTKHNIPLFDVKMYLMKTVKPSFIMGLVIAAITYVIFNQFQHDGLPRFIATCSVSSILVLLFTYFFMLDQSLRSKVKNKMLSLVKK